MNDRDFRKNSEGYSDPTAYQAIMNSEGYSDPTAYQAIMNADGSITLIDQETGKVWR